MGKHIRSIVVYAFFVSFSVSLAFSLPDMLGSLAGNLPSYWSLIETDKRGLASFQMGTAVSIFVFFGVVRRAVNNQKLARIAKTSGLVMATPSAGTFSHPAGKSAKKIKEEQSFGREIMIIGSTGYRSFVAPEGDLHDALQNCREAKIMLLDPREHGAIDRATGIKDPEITAEAIREQIAASIEFIKKACSFPKAIRLKLYPDMPLLKLAILGEYVYVRHYHTEVNVRSMPEFVFKNVARHGGLYIPLYRYFLSRWQDPDIPEYDLDTDDLVYHDQLGYEVLREPFSGMNAGYEEIFRHENGTHARPHYVFR